MKITLKGKSKTFQQLRLDLDKATETHLQKQATKLLTTLKDKTPIDTGEAREGWKLSGSGDKRIISNDVEHLRYLNEGSSRQAPSHFIESTALQFGTPLGAITEFSINSAPR